MSRHCQLIPLRKVPMQLHTVTLPWCRAWSDLPATSAWHTIVEEIRANGFINFFEPFGHGGNSSHSRFFTCFHCRSFLWDTWGKKTDASRHHMSISVVCEQLLQVQWKDCTNSVLGYAYYAFVRLDHLLDIESSLVRSIRVAMSEARILWSCRSATIWNWCRAVGWSMGCSCKASSNGQSSRSTAPSGQGAEFWNMSSAFSQSCLYFRCDPFASCNGIDMLTCFILVDS